MVRDKTTETRTGQSRTPSPAPASRSGNGGQSQKKKAEEDRRKAEEAETRNQADMLIYSVEKALRELGDKVSSQKRGEIEAAIRALKEKLEAKADIASIRAAMEELKRVSGEVAAEAYRQAGSAEAAGSGEKGDQEKGGDYIDYQKE